MSYNNYNITIPYKDFLKLKGTEKFYNDLVSEIKSCYMDKGNNIMEVDITKLKNIGIEFLPSRFLDYSFDEIR